MRLFLALSLALFATAARAETPETKANPNEWHAGLNLRTELGTHPVRIDGGVQLGRLDLIAVVDPMFWTDGQIDLDLLAAWRVSEKGWSVLGGWRTTAIGIPGGKQWQEKLVLGALGRLPDIGSYVHPSFGFELATVLAKHGGGLETEVLSFKNSRYYIDLLNFGMFLRFEYRAPLGGE